MMQQVKHEHLALNLKWEIKMARAWQPYYGGGGLADFSLASRAPKVHDENENRTRKRATKTTTNKHKTCITVH